MVLEFLSNAIGAVKGWFEWKSSGGAQNRDAEKIVTEKEDAAKERRAKINRAVHEGDADWVNAIVSGGIVVALGIALAALALGCKSPEPKPVYVAADREVTCVTNESGRVMHWRVPPLVMEELLNSKVELEELKHNNKIKEITK